MNEPMDYVCTVDGKRLAKARRHGLAREGKKSRTYHCWIHLRQRCLNKNDSDYSRYGGRGIKVCKRWDSYENFLADMGERPPDTSIDRIDNNGDYEPSNCRWATHKQQHANRTTTAIDLSGKRFGRLVAIERLPTRSKSGSLVWKCRCDCGVVKDVRGPELRSGSTRSCGCILRESCAALGRSGAGLLALRKLRAIKKAAV